MKLILADNTPDDKLSRRTVLIGAAHAAVAGWVMTSTTSSSVGEESAATANSLDPTRYVIWDAHGHLGPPGATPSEQLERILTVADRVGIERVVLFMGYPWVEDPTPDELRRQNDQVLEAIASSGGRALGIRVSQPEAHAGEPRRAGSLCARRADGGGQVVGRGPLSRRVSRSHCRARRGTAKRRSCSTPGSRSPGNLPGRIDGRRPGGPGRSTPARHVHRRSHQWRLGVRHSRDPRHGERDGRDLRW